MRAKDYPAFEARTRKQQEAFDMGVAECNFLRDESFISWRWRMNPLAMEHTWDFYFDEVNFS